MISGRLNLAVGALGFVLAGLGGFALGMTLTPYFERGFAAVPLARFFLRAGHTHGMLVALFNLGVGLALERLPLGERARRACALAAAASVLLAVGLVLRGITGGAMTFAPIAMLGGFSLVASSAVLAAGWLRPARAEAP